jgi:hypothetical protein
MGKRICKRSGRKVKTGTIENRAAPKCVSLAPHDAPPALPKHFKLQRGRSETFPVILPVKPKPGAYQIVK